MTDSDKAALAALGETWQKATASGDKATASRAHESAEAIRSAYGYSGGPDGSDYIPLASTSTASTTTSTLPSYTGTTYTGATDQSGLLSSLYSAYGQARAAALQSAYNKTLASLNQQRGGIDTAYDDAAKQTAASASAATLSANEKAAAEGLGDGASSQLTLSRLNALTGALGENERERASEIAALEEKKQSLAETLASDLAAADSETKVKLLQALYSEAVRLDEANTKAQQNQAAENYKVWQSLVANSK